MLRRFRLLCFAALLTLGAGQARADFVLSLVGGAPTGSGPFTYTYDVSLQPNSALVPGGGGVNSVDFFTIYDFNGYVPGSAALGSLTGFTIIAQNVGINPATQTPPVDNPGIANITFTYALGTTTAYNPATSGFLGTVTLQSTLPLGARTVFYSGASQDSAASSVIANNTNQVLGPLASAPEPASVAMLGTGLVAVLGLGLRRRKKA
jgi:hypothetical protein